MCSEIENVAPLDVCSEIENRSPLGAYSRDGAREPASQLRIRKFEFEFGNSLQIDRRSRDGAGIHELPSDEIRLNRPVHGVQKWGWEAWSSCGPRGR